MAKQFKFLVIAGLLLVVIFACQGDETFLQDEKGISLEEARQFFEKQETEKTRNGIDLKITPKWETFQEKTNTKENVTFATVDVSVEGSQTSKIEAVFIRENRLIEMKLFFHSTNPELAQGVVITDANGTPEEVFIKKSEQNLSAFGGIVISVNTETDIQMPGGKDDPRFRFIDQYGRTLMGSERRYYLYKINEYKSREVRTQMMEIALGKRNNFGGVLWEERSYLERMFLNTKEQVIQLDEVVLDQKMLPKKKREKIVNIWSTIRALSSSSVTINFDRYKYPPKQTSKKKKEQQFIIAPDTPVADIAEFLECFDTNKGATLTIYVDEPNPATGDVRNGVNVGHTFISLSQNGNVATYGFYPKVSGVWTVAGGDFTSIMGDDGGHKYSIKVSTEISGEQLKNIIKLSTQHKNIKYNLEKHNCTDFATEVARWGGLKLPNSVSNWMIGKGSNPGRLGKVLRSSGIKNIDKTAGNAPKSHKNC
ncbi:hypothetical protein [Capnocytophaga sp.]|uniref:hypothetical protein n=1 Tax=Capnocytophaga sp. TaxID=44737 RepID=UPI0026DBA35E|nr:hypothetical protein [Capnocytophaga sp.]MDO5104623.1 hypothetical protein [Capnocytophaga sp.]